ncbi:hypothetical protein JN00_0247 [Metamycoplasma subdolum]|uniref:Uncharacterized protein n=1 Tax=Metamycoplasma subdolum TaxID=92407 RepID=A0A3M0A1U0_9BACT|nr:hypothetical protein [Metamycoplasma subdolum]RMA78606.1 hypothetical protein JN00_0247 [Metamycoplasma subdolum]WPB50259.1 hypothetical protein R9C05_01435 [Metamycoplasma subdolum]
MKKSKLWLVGLSALPLAVASLSASCSCVKKNQAEDRKVVIEYNSKLSHTPFIKDGSRSFGGYVSGILHYLTGTALVRRQGLNQAQVKTEGREQKIVDPSWWKYRLDGAKAIVLTFDDNTVKVYDNDEASDKAKPGADGYYSSMSVQLLSKDAKSINNPTFFTDLENSKKVQFVVREGQKYVTSDGKDSGYTVKPRDYWYSWIRTATLTTSTRHSLGGSDATDKLIRDKLFEKVGNVYLTSQEEYANEYLYGVFGVDSEKFYKEETFLQDVAASSGFTGKAVTFESNDKTSRKLGQFFDKVMCLSQDFYPAPSEYIDKLNAEGKQEIYNYLGKSSSDAEAIKAEINKLNKDSAVFKAGVYWYGISGDHTLYTGPYYAEREKSNLKEVYKQNPHYWDQAWVKDKESVKVIENIYQSQPVDTAIYQTRVFDKYKLGQLSQISFNQLNESQKQEILKNPDKFGLQYVKGENKTHPHYWLLKTPFVQPTDSADPKSFYGFNDAYATLVWGSNLEDIKAGKQKPNTFINGTGLSFRTMLTAAIDWDAVQGLATNGVGKAWMAKLAKDGSLGGIGTPGDTVYKYADEVNSLFAIDKDGKKIDFGTELGQEISPSENEKSHAAHSTVSQKLMSAGLSAIKPKMKELLDELFAKPEFSGLPKDQQVVKGTFWFPFTNAPQTLISAAEALSKAISELLDERIQIKFDWESNKDEIRFKNFRYFGANGESIAPWGYDFDSIASGYDGLSWTACLLPQLIYIAKEKPANFATTFPQIAKLADALIDWESKHPVKGPVPFAELYKISHSLIKDYATSHVNSQFEKSGESWTLKLSGGKPIEFKDSTDLFGFSANFWFNYVKDSQNTDLIKLIQELTTYVTVNWTYSTAVGRSDFSPILLGKEYKFTTVSDFGAGVDLFQDWKISKK